MNQPLIDRLVNTVLYEGYMLYPYRASAVKNQQRFNFGALYPEAYSRAQSGSDAWTMQTECLIEGGAETVLEVRSRFLHLLSRDIGELPAPWPALPGAEPPEFHLVETLDTDSGIYQRWQEAAERDACVPGIPLHELAASTSGRKPLRIEFAFPASRETEPIRDQSGHAVGIIIRTQLGIRGAIEVSATEIGHRLFKVTTRVLNLTALDKRNAGSRNEALMRSLLSTHTILSVQNGDFVSLLEPPDALRDMALSCNNVGAWPVLVGEQGDRDCMLSSPIILYDYPQIAPESAGDLFDGTEIDEILTLRVMTLTDQEKREIRGGDQHARRILERSETMPLDQLLKMHGVLRPVHRNDQ